MCYIDSMKSRKEYRGRQGTETWWPRCFSLHGCGGCAAGALSFHPAAIHGHGGRQGRRPADPRDRRPPPCAGPPWRQNQRGAMKARHFCPQNQKILGLLRYAKQKHPENLSPPLGGITERAGAGQNAKRTREEKTKPADLHRRGGKGGRLQWRSRRKQP